MLNEKGAQPRMPRNLRRERRLWHRPQHKQQPLGCQGCKEHGVCGGIRIAEGIFNCSSFCCDDPAGCKFVCRHNPDFPFRIREIMGFALDNVPRAPVLASPLLPPVVQVMYNAGGLHGKVTAPVICLPLFRMFDRNGIPRFADAQALREAYHLARETRIILTGTDEDAPLERYWSITTSARLDVIRALRACDVEFVTTPNFSLLANRPRWQDMHAMKRIALTHEEFLREGIPAGLHVNARTGHDFRRWTAYIAARPEVTDIAFEFTTLRRERRPQYANWLNELAGNVGRPLRLFVRGGTEIVPLLKAAYSEIVFLDTNAFIKTSKRQCAALDGKGRLRWKPTLTLYGEGLDSLLETNIAHETADMIARLSAR